MAFDPDEYLNETGTSSTATAEFDPDAYLEEEDEQGFDPDAYLIEESPLAGLEVPPAPEPLKVEQAVKSIGQIEGIKNAAMNAFDSSRQAMAVAGGVTPEEAEQISKLEYQKEARKLSPAYSEYLQAEGMDAVKAFAKNPFEITTNIITEGLAGSLYSLGAGVAAGGIAAGATAATGVGVPLAPAAFLGGQIGGTFAGSLATEYGGKVLEELQNAGMDIKDPESIQKFFGDEKLMEGARSQALKRGVPVAIFDGVSAGIGGRLARLPIQALTKTPTRLAVTEGVAQAALGGGGEIAGALAAGEEIQPKAVFGEVIGEVGPAAAEITVGRIAERLAKTPEQKQFDQNVIAAQVATRASQDVAPASADALERQVQDAMASAAETPEQRVVRLQMEAQAGAGIELEEETANRFFESARSIVVPQIRQIDPEIFRTELNTIETRIAENAFTVADLDQTQFKTILSPEAYTQISTLFEENPQLAAQTLRQVIERELGIGGGGGGEGEPPVAGLPPVEPTPPVTPTPEAAVAPVEPVVPTEEVAQPPTPEAAPTPEIAQAAQTRITEREGQAVTLPEEPTGNRVEAAAYQAPDGTVYYGPSHLDAMGKALDAGKIEQAEIDAKQETTSRETPEFGFATNADPFVTRDQAETIARQSGQITVEQPATGKLHSNEVSLDAFAEPVVPTPTAVPAVNDAEYLASVERGDNEAAQRLVDSAFRAATKPETTDAVFERHKDFKMMGLTLEEIAQNPEALAEKDKDDYDTVMYWVSQIEQGNTPTVVADEKGSLWDGFHRLVASKIAGGETLNVFTSEKETSTDQLSQTVRRDAEGNVIPLSERFPTAPTVPTTTAAAPTIPQLEPLRRVARAEQTEEDVAGLVDGGLVELYKGQPVITQAGIDALPEAERPRLTPEARKIQIDTGASDVVAEAISKNLRIGVDQVPIDFRMPAGWTLVEDIYVPPTRMAKIETFDVETLAEVDETSDVFADVIKRKDEAKAVVVQKPEGSAFATQDEFRAAFDLRGEGHGRFATRLDLMVADGVITSDGRDLIMAVIYDNNTDDVFLKNMEMGSFRNRVTSAYGRGGVSRQTVESAKGKAIGVKPSLRMIRNARRDLDIDARTAQTLSTFWHEFGHAGYYSLLDKAQKDKISSIYRKTTKAQREKFFGEGVAAARQENVTARYYAKSETEWFAQSFAEYVLTKKSDQKGLVPIFESILTKIKGVFGKLFSRKEGTPELEDIFEYIIQGKDYGTTKIWWNGMQMSLSPALYGVGGAQPVDPQFSKRLLEREKQNRAKARKSITAPEAIAEEPAAVGEIPPTAEEPIPAPTFTEGTPEAATLKAMEASMAKVDAASEAKGGKPETQKISEIASVWMDSGLGERELQDAITEYTNLTPANAKRVARAIAKQYDTQQQIAEAVLETEAGAALEGVPEGMEIPKDVDPKNKRTVLQRVIDATTGVRVKPVILQIPEKTALKEQIRLKARETREAKKAQQETADAVVEAIKSLELRGPMRAKQAQALAKRAAKVIWTSEKSMENFMAYAERVMANTNYDADLREAKAAQKRAKELSKRDSIAAPQRFVLEAIGNIGINLLNDPREFADVVNHYLRSFKPVVSEAYVVVPDAEMESYLSMAEDEVNESKAEFDVEDNEKLAEKYGVSVNDLQRFLDAEDIMDALASYAKREAIEGILNEKSAGVKEALKGVDTTTLRADQRKLIDAMKVIDVKSLDAAEKQAYVRIGNNIIFNNNQTNGAEFFVATAKGQQAARDLAKNTAAMTKNKAWANILPSLGSRKAKKLLKSWASELQSIADTFRNAFGKEAMTVFYEAMGMVDLDLGFTQAARTLEEIQEKMARFYDKLGKKYKGAATNQDGILSEGIVGYLIQNVPAKGEADSLAQRRGLMQQNVANLRKSGDEDKIQMADRIQQLMQRLDGETVDQIFSNLKREYPANYESLMWLKDELFPQYKDFLKFSDENFNDQANNYNTPNYLPIIYSNASPALDLLQGKKKYYDNLSSSPKQSSYTIKRSDYTQLPMGSDGRTPKEIGLNLRKNAYNSLSDQITRAYTNPARQRIYSFLKTPEAEEALGGKANLDFFADRIERLMGSRERRGSLNEGFFGKAVDVIANLVRDIGTRIALAGSYQLIRQPADQVTVAVGATGRADLMAEHLAPRSIKNARPVLDLFSIGRRGDASSGYKYINQMEGAQSRLERYYTEGNWVKAKEAATRLSDKFMAPLKVSDFTVAAATWMTFYRAYLAKNGIKFTNWEDAANLIKSDDAGHRRAAAYAENMTDIYQGSSDPTKMAVFAQKGKTGTENLLKSILVPFNSFGIQFRARVSSDITEIFTKSGDWKGKAIAAKDLSATIGGTFMFGLAKRFVLPAITYGGIKILYGIFGVDVEEPDEEKKKEEFDQKWRQLQGDIISTMVVGGFGQMIEGHTIDGMNYIKYMIDTANESESVLDDDGEIMSFNEYSKERAPFYRYRSFDNAPSLGMLDIGMDQARKSVLNTKMVLTPEEMERFTPEEQRFLYVALLSDWLYLAGFNDADFARMWDKGRRDMIKARKEEEKELKRIREGR